MCHIGMPNSKNLPKKLYFACFGSRLKMRMAVYCHLGSKKNKKIFILPIDKQN
jgi:hypothetical protein